MFKYMRISLQYGTLRYVTLHYIHYTTLHYIALRYVTLHYITLHTDITVHTHTRMYICAYIARERERVRERDALSYGMLFSGASFPPSEIG